MKVIYYFGILEVSIVSIFIVSSPSYSFRCLDFCFRYQAYHSATRLPDSYLSCTWENHTLTKVTDTLA